MFLTALNLSASLILFSNGFMRILSLGPQPTLENLMMDPGIFKA